MQCAMEMESGPFAIGLIWRILLLPYLLQEQWRQLSPDTNPRYILEIFSQKNKGPLP